MANFVPAQISYNQQYGENQWKSQFGMPQTPAPAQNGNWMDVTVGTDIPFTSHMAAYASLAQGRTARRESSFVHAGRKCKFLTLLLF